MKRAITAFFVGMTGVFSGSVDALVFVGSSTYNSGDSGADQKPQILSVSSGDFFVTANNMDSQFWIGKFDDNFNFLSDVNFQAYNSNSVFPITTNSQGDLFAAGVVETVDRSLDIWIAKYDDSLVFKASSTFTGGGLYLPGRGTTSYQDVPNGITVGAGDKVFLTGHINCCGGYGGIGWTGAYGSDLALLSSATFKGPYLHPQYDDAYPDIGDGFAVVAGTGGYVYVVGNIFDIQSNNQTFWALWTGKYDMDLVFISSAVYAIDSTEVISRPKSIALDVLGNVYVAASLAPEGSDGPALLVKYSSDLELLADTIIQPSVGDIYEEYSNPAIVVDQNGRVFVGSSFTGGNSVIREYDANLVFISSLPIPGVDVTDIGIRGGLLYATGSRDGGVYISQSSPQV